MWNATQIHDLLEQQRNYFLSGQTLDLSFRLRQLERLEHAVRKYESRLIAALHQDLGRHEMEGYFCDVGSLLMEIRETRRGLRRWARPEVHFSSLACFPSLITRVYRMPYGVTLIISPFNFPILLSLGVLAAAIAGGNTAILKTSSKSSHCTSVLMDLVKETFSPEYISLVDGGHDTADLLLEERFDKIFYTGSPGVARHIMEKAARHLTPVALELGGETGNFAVVRADADIKDAARKIAFFKLLNSGQVCININQVAVAREVADDFIRELKLAFERQIGTDPLKSPEYPRLISPGAWQKCADEAKACRDRIVFGGHGNMENLRFEPTLIYPASLDEPLTNHELFSPLLPVIPFDDRDIDRLMDAIARREHGLALYLFTRSRKWAVREMTRQQYGGGCINEVCVHMMVPGVPFGGTGHSGMGAYHGRYGFMEFTHPSTVLFGHTHLNPPLREHPYNRQKEKLIRMVEK